MAEVIVGMVVNTGVSKFFSEMATSIANVTIDEYMKHIPPFQLEPAWISSN